MKRFFAAACIAAGSLCAADLTGSWGCEVTTDMGSGNPSFELKQTGAAVTGKYTGALGEADVTGKADGAKFEVQFKVDAGVVKYAGELTGNDSKGKVDIAGQATGTFTCKRK